MQTASGGKMLRLRWAATCMDCGESLVPGDRALWFHVDDVGRCVACVHRSEPSAEPVPINGAAVAEPVTIAPSEQVAPTPEQATAPVPPSRTPPRREAQTRTVPGQRRLRYPATCAGCGVGLPAGSTASWDCIAKAARCLACATGSAGDASQARPVRDATSDVQPAPLDPGVAGASARRQYERRAAREQEKKQAAIEADEKWRTKVRADRPVLGRIATAVTPKPRMTPESQATAAWKTGAAGEERVAQVLAGASITALHDRRVPGSKANIDHIAVGPAGVFVIDAKKYKGRIERRDVGSWRNPDVRLYVNGRNQTKLVHAVAKQCEVVRTSLGDLADSTPVHGVLCFVGAEWPGWRPKPIGIDTVTCTWPLGLPSLVTAGGPLTAEQISATAGRLAATLPAA